MNEQTPFWQRVLHYIATEWKLRGTIILLVLLFGIAAGGVTLLWAFGVPVGEIVSAWLGG
jgi:hypothetical protein